MRYFKWFHRYVLILSCLTLTCCGVKPGAVDAPAGAEDKVFPRTYPDPSTDPQY